MKVVIRKPGTVATRGKKVPRALVRSFRAAVGDEIKAHGRAGRPVFLVAPGTTRGQWVRVDRNGSVVEQVGPTLRSVPATIRESLVKRKNARGSSRNDR
jgi:hypothetical protein